jgi:hypothetical protein
VEGRRLSVYFMCLAWRLWKSVVPLAVAGNITFGAIVWCQRRPVFEWQRLALYGIRLDIRRLSGRVNTPTYCELPVFSVAVMEKSCDACGDNEYYLRSGISVSADVTVLEASTSVDGKSMGHTTAERSWKDADFLCTSSV